MNYLVTAGGTAERIDAVRSITNNATGRLGSLVADELARLPGTERIFYLHGKNAAVPSTDKALLVPIGDTASLEQAVRTTLANNPVAGIVHTMAVSDYQVRAVTTASALAKDISQALSTMTVDVCASKLETATAVVDAINAHTGLERENKIGSYEEDLALLLEPTPKIISLLRTLAPKACIVGFKLLDHVPLDTLIDTAYALLQKNDCTYVLANDAQDIGPVAHKGYLVDRHKHVTPYEGKQAIAEGIVRAISAYIIEDK
jgi:phosphopantothenate-cysteine ligase